jgi:integrase
VRYRLGGREASQRYGGIFRTEREARARRDWIAGELAALRVPNLELLDPEPEARLRDVATAWQSSRISITEGTRTRHGVELARILPVLGDQSAAAVTKSDVRSLVAQMHGDGLARESIRKTVSTLAQVLDHAEVAPNPARGVELPEKDVEEVRPPSADHIETVLGAVPARHRLALLTLEASGMRVGELERLTWGDVDEDAQRWRVSAARTKTRRSRWVDVPAPIFEAVLELLPREDRDLEARVFTESTADRLRTALARACRATGTPLFSPHDLRHRRASLWHLAGVSAAEASSRLGHSPTEHLRTYAHVVLDRREIDRLELLRAVRNVRAPVVHTRVE